MADASEPQSLEATPAPKAGKAPVISIEATPEQFNNDLFLFSPGVHTPGHKISALMQKIEGDDAAKVCHCSRFARDSYCWMDC